MPDPSVLCTNHVIISTRFVREKVAQALAKADEAADPATPLSREEFCDDLALTSMARCAPQPPFPLPSPSLSFLRLVVSIVVTPADHRRPSPRTPPPLLSPLLFPRLWDVGKSEPIKVGKASPTEGTLPGSVYFIVRCVIVTPRSRSAFVRSGLSHHELLWFVPRTIPARTIEPHTASAKVVLSAHHHHHHPPPRPPPPRQVRE